MSEISRIMGIFFEPKKAFTDIAQRPTWIVPLVLVIICAIGVSTLIGQHVGWERIFRHQAETNSRIQQLPAEQRESTIQTQAKFAPIFGVVGVLLVIPIYDVVIAAVLLGIAGGLMGGGMRFKQVFAIVCYAGMPGVISAILTALVIFLKNPDEFNLQNPLAFNAGAFMDPNTTSKFLYSVSTSLDLFVIWTILLLATGLKAAAGKKLTFAGALVAVAVPWALFVIGKASIAGIFS